MKKINITQLFSNLYKLICYLIGLTGMVWMVLFEENILIKKTIDNGVNVESGSALIQNIGLLILFGIFHSGLAREEIKRILKKYISEQFEKYNYLFISGIVLIFICYKWSPIPIYFYDFSDSIFGQILVGLNFIGVLFILMDLFLPKKINYFFSINNIKKLGKEKKSYHRLYVGFFLIFWVSDSLTLGHLLFAIGMSTYIYFGIYFEEKDLIRFYKNKKISQLKT